MQAEAAQARRKRFLTRKYRHLKEKLKPQQEGHPAAILGENGPKAKRLRREGPKYVSFDKDLLF